MTNNPISIKVGDYFHHYSFGDRGHDRGALYKCTAVEVIRGEAWLRGAINNDECTCSVKAADCERADPPGDVERAVAAMHAAGKLGDGQLHELEALIGRPIHRNPSTF